MRTEREFSVTDPEVHRSVFGKDQKQTAAFLQKMDAKEKQKRISMDRSDYLDALWLLHHLDDSDESECKRFIERINKLKKDLKRLDFRTRCRFMYQLLVNYIIPESKRMMFVDLPEGEMFIGVEGEHDKYARIGISYQATLDAVIALTKAEDKQQLWMDMLSEALQKSELNT